MLGIESFADAQKRGVAVIHDSRFLGEFFAKVVIRQLSDAGIRAIYGGEATTAEISIYDRVTTIATNTMLSRYN